MEQENAELGTEEINDSVHQAQGIVMDATMNGFTMVTSKKEYSLGKRTINRRYIRGFIHGHRR